MKIFGAALIVSGGYLLGRLRVVQWNRRLNVLGDIHELFKKYSAALAEYRLSPKDYFSEQGTLGIKILNGESIEGLCSEDQDQINKLVGRMKKESYQEVLAACRSYMCDQEILIKKIKEETGSSGKAMPLVTGAIGFLIAVFLF